MHFPKNPSRTAYAAVGPSRYHWQPGLKHLPYKGLGALLLGLVGVVVSVAILIASNGDDVRRWRFQPTVYLSIASTITNITVAYALLEGVTIAWWQKALKEGTNVGDLHRIWEFGHGFLSAVLSARHVSCPSPQNLHRQDRTMSRLSLSSDPAIKKDLWLDGDRF